MLEQSSVSQGELTVDRPQLHGVSGFLSFRPAAVAGWCVRTASDRGTLLCMSKVGNETCYFLIPDRSLTFYRSYPPEEPNESFLRSLSGQCGTIGSVLPSKVCEVANDSLNLNGVVIPFVQILSVSFNLLFLFTFNIM